MDFFFLWHFISCNTTCTASHIRQEWDCKHLISALFTECTLPIMVHRWCIPHLFIGIMQELFARCPKSLITLQEFCLFMASHFCHPGIQPKFSKRQLSITPVLSQNFPWWYFHVTHPSSQFFFFYGVMVM